jgi:hypothetical protein
MKESEKYNSRQSTNEAQVISRSTTLSAWDRTKPTKILVHGFLDTVNSTWWPQMKDAFLQAVCVIFLSSSPLFILSFLSFEGGLQCHTD